MEPIHVLLDQVADFDRLIHGGLMQASTVTFATKPKCTVGGHPGCVIAFDVQLPDGQIAHAQATVTVRNLLALGMALRSRYPELTESADSRLQS